LGNKTLQVGTFNVRWASPDDGEHRWDLRKERLFALLHDWRPDVLGLQEPRAAQLDDLRQALPEYDSVAVGRDDGERAGEFCPIFFRRERLERVSDGTFWFSETPDVPGSQAWESSHPRICTWVELRERESGASFRVYNLHWDHQSQAARENSALLLRGFLRTVIVPMIVLGDFNAHADNPAVAHLTLPDSPVPHSAFTPAQQRQPGTFHGFTGTPSEPPIDHILLSPEWEVLKAEVLYGDGSIPFASDHFPVAATLLIR
jgi:endonuclease/exonuclease/phosphatase family metal-dependent hydrolase